MQQRIRMADTTLSSAEIVPVIDCMTTGNLRAGEYVEKFEREVAKRTESAWAIAVTNGTTALWMALKSFLRPGDAVVIPAFNFIAAANAVVLAGGVPVFCDVDPETWLIDVDALERILESRPIRAICPVHLFGAPCDINQIQAIASVYGALVVWDACQAFGAELHGRGIGGNGWATVYSFYPTKPAFAAEGGAITYGMVGLDGPEMVAFREHGWNGSKYVSESIGGNFRMNELSAAIGYAQLSKGLQAKREKQRLEVANHIMDALRGYVVFQEITPGAKSVYSVLAMWTFGNKRDQVRAHLLSDGIDTVIHYPVGLHRQPSMKNYTSECPRTDELCGRIISIPCHHGMTIEDADRVVQSVRKAI